VPKTPFAVEQVLTILATTPARLGAVSDDLTPNQLRTAPVPDQWSANDVLAHLRSCADVWGGYIATILAEDRPTLRAIDPRTYMLQTYYPDLDFVPSLRAFAAQRAELLAVLEALPPERWSRTATVTGAGAVLQKTVLTYAARLARHERPHVKQVARIVAAVRA